MVDSNGGRGTFGTDESEQQRLLRHEQRDVHGKCTEWLHDRLVHGIDRRQPCSGRHNIAHGKHIRHDHLLRPVTQHDDGLRKRNAHGSYVHDKYSAR
jgi:hypothetical protein